MSEELVLTIQAADYREPVGVVYLDPREIKEEIDRMLRSSGEFSPRATVEDDPTRLQIIPYVLFTWGHPLTQRIFHYSRAKKSGEQRLVGKRSVGVGGHINPVDGVDVEANGHSGDLSYSMVHAAAAREIKEELGVQQDLQTVEPYAFVYMTDTPVNSVHLGVIFRIHLPGAVAPTFTCENTKVDPGWIPLRKAHVELGEYETWSQLAIETIFQQEVR